MIIMFIKEFEVSRKGDWLILNPIMKENVVTISKIPAEKHILLESDYFSLNSIIDLRKELKNEKFIGHLNFLFKFDDKEIDESLNIEKIYIKALNRFKFDKDMLYYCHDVDNQSNQYFYHNKPCQDGAVYIGNKILLVKPIASSYSWIFTGPTLSLSYNECLATDRKGPLKRISKNGWGFFRIAIKMPNTNYTPNKITAIILSSHELVYIPNQDNSNNNADIYDEPPPLYEDIN